MNIATLYPARTDTEGHTWYRAGTGPQDGWTAQPQYAHADYFTEDALRDRYNPPEEMPMTELTVDETGNAIAYEDPYPRRSEICGFPLPPFPEQINVDTDGWNRYKLPSPTTGKLTAYTRATTVAGVTPDDYNLVQWKIREKVRATIECMTAWNLASDPETAGAIDDDTINKGGAYQFYLNAMDGGKGREINAAIDRMHDICGGAESREHGGAVHDWIAEVDMGRCLIHQVPEEYQIHVRAYQDAMARAGLIAIPAYTERLVLHTTASETVAGRLDGIAFCAETGRLHVIDRKTSKTLDFSALEFGVQVAGVYSGASLMLKNDRSGWDPMPDVDKELAFILHVPSDQPERSQVVPISIPAGEYALNTALQVRAERRNADKVFFGQAYPIPSPEALRYVQAWQRLQDLHDHDDALSVMQEYADVWDDALAEFGTTCYALLGETDA